MKTIKNSKEITTLEVGDEVVFGNLRYVVNKNYRNLSFPTYELAQQFLTNFNDLIEIAKPLL